MDYSLNNTTSQNNSPQRPILKWIIFYLVIGAVAYGLAYYLYFGSRGPEKQMESETLTNDSVVAKTYTSDNYYVSVLWPPNWKIEKGSMGIVLSGNEGSFSIAWSGLGGGCDEDKVRQFTKGENAYWICNEKPDGLYTYATVSKSSNENIAIGIIPAARYSSEDEKWLFFKVLENIKFDPQGIADWKMHTNNQYGFTLKYPENFFETDGLQMVASQCATEKFLTDCPNRMDEKIIIKGVQYCHNQHAETSMGRTYYYDSYMTVRNYDAYSRENSAFCLSVLLKTSEENCQKEQEANYDNCLKKNEERPKILETIVPTFKFIK